MWPVSASPLGGMGANFDHFTSNNNCESSILFSHLGKIIIIIIIIITK